MNAGQILAAAAAVVAVAAVAAGLYLAGAPSEERALRLDERRLADLQRLANALDGYWRANSALPDTLGELIVGQRLRVVPVDPVSGDPYDYEIDDANSYRLCAEFARPAREPEADGFWAHGPGRECFDVSFGQGE